MKIGKLPLVPYYRLGDEGLGDAVRCLAGKHTAVMLANHGPVVSGKKLDAAVYAMEELEETAKLYLLIQSHNPRCLTPDQIVELEQVFWKGRGMISNAIGLMVPTRGRPALLERYAKSVAQTANDPSRIEIHTYIDQDDPALDEYLETIEQLSVELGVLGLTFAGVVGDPIVVPGAMNELGRVSTSDILVMSNDDQIYTTFGWDDRIDREAVKFPDGIFLFWFADGIESDRWCCFPIVGRRWIECLNYYAPTMFEHFFDTWLWDIALRIGRAHYLPDVKVEHIAAWANFAPEDDTARRTRGPLSAGRLQRDNLGYNTLGRYREIDAQLLRGLLEPSAYERSDGHPVGMPRDKPSRDPESQTIHFHFQPNSIYK